MNTNMRPVRPLAAIKNGRFVRLADSGGFAESVKNIQEGDLMGLNQMAGLEEMRSIISLSIPWGNSCFEYFIYS
jgi:hypothetical protein